MSYKNPKLTRAFAHKTNTSIKEVEAIFTELKKFLFLSAISKEMLSPSNKVDELWHQFILFTKDYRNFCITFFGKFIEHEPFITDVNERENGNPPESYLRTYILLYVFFEEVPNSKYWDEVLEFDKA